MSRGIAQALVAIALLCAPARVAAQVNIEGMRQESPDEGLSARLSAGLSTRSGNVDITNLELGGRAEYVRGRDTFFFVFAGDYGWKDGDRFSDQGLVHVRFTRSLNDRFALESFAQTDYNGARLLDARALAGGGVRARIVDSGRVGIAVGTSYMFEHEEIDVPPGAIHPVGTDVSRWNNYVGLRWTITDNARFSLTGYAQPQFDDLDDIRVIAQSALEAALGGPVSLSVTFRIRHDSEPPDGVEDTDSKLSTGLTVSF